MKKSIKTIGTIATVGIMLVGAYWLGTTQAGVQTTAAEIKETEKVIEIVPDGYIDTNSDEFYNNYVDMRQIVDFTATDNGLQLYLEDGDGYYWER